MKIELSIIIPTYNERQNIEILIDHIGRLFPDKSKYEIIVVDDNSPDGTWDFVSGLSKQHDNIICLHRLNERGLSSAIINGFMAARGEYLAVLDADMQHDETLLVKMLEKIPEYDLIVGSRKVDEGGISEEWGLLRKWMSLIATKMAHTILTTKIKDPMSGFFMIRKDIFIEIEPLLNPKGFKTLLEILYHFPSNKVLELGYQFKTRAYGESKLTQKVMLDYIVSLYELKFGKVIPIDFIKYCFVGLLGVFVNLGSLVIFTKSGMTDELSLILAIEFSIIFNYLLNNFWTFSISKKLGKYLFYGLFKFNIICGLGALINYAIAIFIKSRFGIHLVWADAVGILVATIWNYTMNKKWIWS